MTYGEIRAFLRNGGIEDCGLEAAMIIEKFFGVGRAEILLHPDRNFESVELDEALKKRASRYPLQYILGECGFYGYDFSVNEDVLIPRQDTELSVEVAVKTISANSAFVEPCCGSGCIFLSVLKERPDLTAVAFDLSEAALALCEKNAERLGVSDRAEILRGDVFDRGTWEELERKGMFSALLSNPPYLSDEDMKNPQKELLYEPKLALYGGKNGLDFYGAIINGGKQILREDGIMIFECGATQSEDLRKTAEKADLKTEIYRDIEKRARTVRLFR